MKRDLDFIESATELIIIHKSIESPTPEMGANQLNTKKPDTKKINDEKPAINLIHNRVDVLS